MMAHAVVRASSRSRTAVLITRCRRGANPRSRLEGRPRASRCRRGRAPRGGTHGRIHRVRWCRLTVGIRCWWRSTRSSVERGRAPRSLVRTNSIRCKGMGARREMAPHLVSRRGASSRQSVLYRSRRGKALGAVRVTPSGVHRAHEASTKGTLDGCAVARDHHRIGATSLSANRAQLEVVVRHSTAGGHPPTGVNGPWATRDRPEGLRIGRADSYVRNVPRP